MHEYIFKRALDNHEIISIMYQKGNEFTQRKIKIIKIEGNDIEAYCYLRHQIRHFKKENILAAMHLH